MWGGVQEYCAYELALTSLAASHMSCSSNLDGFRERGQASAQLLLLGLVQYSLQHSCAIAVKLFLHTLSQRPCECYGLEGPKINKEM